MICLPLLGFDFDGGTGSCFLSGGVGVSFTVIVCDVDGEEDEDDDEDDDDDDWCCCPRCCDFFFFTFGLATECA